MDAARGEAKNVIRSAISCGRAGRPSGISPGDCMMICSPPSTVERIDEHIARGELTQVPADWSISRPGLFLYHSSRRHCPAALRAFIDCMLDMDAPGHATVRTIARDPGCP